MRPFTRLPVRPSSRLDQPVPFESVSVVLPVINEVGSLTSAFNTLLEVAGNHVRQVIIVVCEKTTRESLLASEALKAAHQGRVDIVRQTNPFLGGAIQSGVEHATASHVVVMYSDGESDPRAVRDFIAESQRHPEAIISASRWMKKGAFIKYPPVKLFLNLMFQKLFAAIYSCPITDFTFGYRIYPTALMKSIRWEEFGHPFVFESILKPLRLNVVIREIPTTWTRRSEGSSQLNSLVYLRYLAVGIRTRWISPARLLN